MLSLEQFYLLKLMEECSEVAQRCSKQIQFGATEKQSQSPSETPITEDNRTRLRGEVNDLLAVIDVLTEMSQIREISPEELLYAKHRKREKILKYLKYSQDLHTVERPSQDGTEHLLKAWPPCCALHGRKWVCYRDAHRFFPYCAMCTGEETKEGAEERIRLERQNNSNHPDGSKCCGLGCSHPSCDSGPGWS